MARAGMILMNGRNEIVKNGVKKIFISSLRHLMFNSILLNCLAYLIRLASTANRPSVV